MSNDNIEAMDIEGNRSRYFHTILRAALLIGFLLIIFMPSQSTKDSRQFLETADSFMAQNTTENLYQLKSRYSVCAQDNVDWDIFTDASLFHVSCKTKIAHALADNKLNAEVLFDSLIKVNALNFAIEMGFFDVSDRFFGNTKNALDFINQYEGDNYYILKSKSSLLARDQKPKRAYDSIVRAFLSTNDLNLKHDAAGFARGILDEFGCTNDMRVWENYSMDKYYFTSSKPSISTEDSLPIETIKILRAQLEVGAPPELQESCALKYYKL